MVFVRTVTSALAVGCLLVACGGASGNEDLFGGDGTGSSSGSSSGSSGSTSGGVDGSVPADASTDATTDAGRDAKLDGPIGVDVTPPPGDPGIQCGQSPDCTVGAQVCCRITGINGVSYTCTGAGSCAASVERMPIPCDDAADCATLGHGGVCCATYQFDPATQRTTVVQVSCTTASTCTTDNSAVVMCDPKASDACPNGGSCKASQQTFPGYYLCL